MTEKLKQLRGAGGGGKGGGGGGGFSEGPNTLDSGSTASIIDLLSEGEIQGLVNGNQSIFINGVPLQNPDLSYNFNGVTVDFRTGTPNQDYMAGFSSVENEIAVGLQIRHDTPVIRTITDPDIDRALVKIQIPALSYADSSGNVSGASVAFQIWLQSSKGFGTPATGTYPFTVNPVNNYSIVLNGSTWTFVTSGATGNQTNIAGNLAATLAQFAIDLNNSVDPNINVATYSITGTSLKITYATTGEIGNSYTLGTGAIGPLTGGAVGVAATGAYPFTTNPTSNQTIVLNGITWTFVTSGATGNQTDIGGNLAATLTSLAIGLEASTVTALELASYLVSGNNLNITYETTGVAGNSYIIGAGTYRGTTGTLTGGTSGGGYGIPATGAYAFTTNPTNNQTIILNGTTWTFKTSGASGNQTNLGANLGATLSNLVANLNASVDGGIDVATYAISGNNLAISYATAGVAGNAYTLAAGTYGGDVGVAATGSFSFSNQPLDHETIIINGTTWTFRYSVLGYVLGSTELLISGNLANTLAQAVVKLNASVDANTALATYTVSGSKIVATYDTLGTPGNSFTIANGSAWGPIVTTVSGPTLTGGLGGFLSGGTDLDGYVLQVSDTITGKTTSAYQAQYTIDLPPGGAPWDIKCVRVSSDNANIQLSNATWWATYTEIIDEKIQYVDSACIGIKINATQFGTSIPTRSYELYGILLQIPSNYNPTTRVYTGIWDGTFQTAWSCTAQVPRLARLTRPASSCLTPKGYCFTQRL